MALFSRKAARARQFLDGDTEHSWQTLGRTPLGSDLMMINLGHLAGLCHKHSSRRIFLARADDPFYDDIRVLSQYMRIKYGR
ncbi:hypothetical protein VTO73DRAFT_12039 [Trametes versicolor]